MITIETRLCVDVPREQAWHQLARIEDVDQWAESITVSYCDAPVTRGYGAERVCKLKNNKAVREKFTRWEEGRGYSYELVSSDLPLVKNAKNDWSLKGYGDKTLIISLATLELKGGVMGRLFEPLFALIVKRQMPNVAASLKYFIEKGHGYAGSPSKLPRALGLC